MNENNGLEFSKLIELNVRYNHIRNIIADDDYVYILHRDTGF